MPVEASRIEFAIYLSRWIGTLNYDEIRQGQLKGIALAEEDGLTRYVLIVDVTQLGKLPHDVRMMTQITKNDPHLEHVIVVGTTHAITFLGTTIKRLTGRFQDLQFCQTMDEAIHNARQRVANF